MRKIKASLCCLLLVTSSAWAEWVALSTTKDTTNYIDPTTIRKDGNLRKVWEITDYKQRNKDGGMSTRQRAEYDCKSERRKVLSISGHTEPLAGGKELFNKQDVHDDWMDLPPNSAGEATLKRVCVQ